MGDLSAADLSYHLDCLDLDGPVPAAPPPPPDVSEGSDVNGGCMEDGDGRGGLRGKEAKGTTHQPLHMLTQLTTTTHTDTIAPPRPTTPHRALPRPTAPHRAPHPPAAAEDTSTVEEKMAEASLTVAILKEKIKELDKDLEGVSVGVSGVARSMQTLSLTP